MTPVERRRRDEVIERIRDFIRRDERIRLPSFDRSQDSQPGRFALHSIEENEFSGTVGAFRYQIEGEDDLLHLIVVRKDGELLTPEEARVVASSVFECVNPALIWLKPGEFSQHFYLGHDELL